MNKKKLIITLYVLIALSTTSIVFAFDFDPGDPPPPNDITPPVLSIISPSGTVNGWIQIKAKATDSVSGMYCVDFYLDNSFKGRDYTASTGDYFYSSTFDTILFSEGSHTIRVFAFDNEGNYAYKTRTIIVDNVPDPIPVNKYALIVAIGDYSNAKSVQSDRMEGLTADLNYIRGKTDSYDTMVTDGDDDLWYDFLVNKQGWSADNIQFYGDNHPSDYIKTPEGLATRSNILAGLDSWLKNRNQHDIVAIILDGHGYMEVDSNDDPDYSGIITYDGLNLTDADILGKMNTFTPETIFLFVDGCATEGFSNHSSEYSNCERFFVTTSSDYLGKAHAKSYQYSYNEQTYTALNRGWTCFFTYFAFETSGTYYGSLSDHTSLETIYSTMKTLYENWIDSVHSEDTDCTKYDGDSTESVKLWTTLYYP